MIAAAGLFLSCWLAVPDPAAAPQSASPPVGRALPIARRADASEQLAHARALKVQSYRASPARRPDLTRRAIEAYRAVRYYYPEAVAIAAEAAFRAGRLLATEGRSDEALREFGVAAELGAGTPFRARARLESGHVHRRASSPSPALDSYLSVASDPQADRRHRDEAWLRIGDLWCDRERADEARRAWRQVAHGGLEARDRVRAFDRLGTLRVAHGDLEGAAGVLHECRTELREVLAERTELGERIRRAVRGMRLVGALPRCIEARREESAKQTRGDLKSFSSDLAREARIGGRDHDDGSKRKP